MSNIVFFLGSELVIIDSLAAAKLFDLTDSPYWQARHKYWQQWEELFPLDAPYNPCFYWQDPPKLLLPERAVSLHDWSHCQLDNSLFDENSICEAKLIALLKETRVG